MTLPSILCVQVKRLHIFSKWEDESVQTFWWEGGKSSFHPEIRHQGVIGCNPRHSNCERLQGEVLGSIANTFCERIQAARYLLHVCLVPKFSHPPMPADLHPELWVESPVTGLGLGNLEFLYIRNLYFQPTPYMCPCLWLLENLNGTTKGVGISKGMVLSAWH